MGQASMDREDVLRRVNTQYSTLTPAASRIPASEQAYVAGDEDASAEGAG